MNDTTQTFDISKPVLVPFARYRWDKVRDQHQIVYPEGVLVLNPTGNEIVKRLDGRTLDELVADLEQTFSSTEIRADVVGFLKGLFDHGLLRDGD